MDNLESINNDEIPAIIDVSEPHMALLFLVDTSATMKGESIYQLTEGINSFIKDINQSDTGINKILDVAIIEFNSIFKVVQEFRPVKFSEPVGFTATSGVTMVPAIEKALEMIKERIRFYNLLGTASFKPWIILISATDPSDDISSVAQVVKDRETDGKLRFISLGVLEYNSNVLHNLSSPKVLKLNGTDFSDFFHWLKLNLDHMRIARASPNDKPWIDLIGNVSIDKKSDL